MNGVYIGDVDTDGDLSQDGEKISDLPDRYLAEEDELQDEPSRRRISPGIIAASFVVAGMVALTIIICIARSGNADDTSSNGLELSYRIDRDQDLYILNVKVRGKVSDQKEVFALMLADTDGNCERIDDIYGSRLTRVATGKFETRHKIRDPRTTTYTLTLVDVFRGERILCKKVIKS